MSSPLIPPKWSQTALLAFAGMITTAAAWCVWNDMFPAEADPTGNPDDWTRGEMRRWLAARNLHPQDSDTREQLLERVKANMR